jgi:uncharacterized membrane protein YraQ (UPF0718 family)
VTTTTTTPRRTDWQAGLFLALLVAAIPLQFVLGSTLEKPVFQTWGTIFLAIIVQSIPFLVFGVVLSGLISTFLSPKVIARVMPRNPALAVPVAGIAGIGLPTCECAAVPVANSMARRGIPSAVALTFLLAAPAVNPAVIVSTAVAFQGRTDMVVARFVASMAIAILIGWIYVFVADRYPGLRLPTLRKPVHVHDDAGRLQRFLGAAWHDFLPAMGFLVIGAIIATSINVLVPISVVESVAGSLLISIIVLATFAFVVALCSEADAFIAASLVAFDDIAKLVFMVVGPVADVKLAAMEAGQFGRKFAQQFVPLVLVVATGIASLVGWLML